MKTPPLSSCIDPGPILLHAGPTKSRAKGALPSVAAFTAAKSSAEQTITSQAGAAAGFPFGKMRLKNYADKLQLQKLLVEARLENAQEVAAINLGSLQRNPLLPVASINIDGSIFGGRRSAPPAIAPTSSPLPKPRACTSPEPPLRPPSGPGFSPPGSAASCGHQGGSWMGAYDTAATDQLRRELGSRCGMDLVLEGDGGGDESRDVPGAFRGRGGDGYEEALEELQGLRHEMQQMENTLQILKPSNVPTTSKSPVSRNPSRASPPPNPPPSNPLEAKIRHWEAQAFGPIIPVTRREAVALKRTLDGIPQSLQFGYEVPFGREDRYKILDTVVVDREFEFLDMVFGEAARQVQASCVEQGQLLNKIRARYGSFLQGWRVFCKKAEDATIRALEKLRVARARARAAESRAERLEQALGRSQADAKALEERTKALQKELSSVQKEAEDQLVALQAAVLTLKHENGQLSDRVQGADAERDAAVSTNVAYLQEDICALIDERNELQEKVERLTGQFVRSKWGGLLQASSPISVATENQAVQTDPQKHRDRSSSDEEDERKRNGSGTSDVSSMFGGLDHTKSKIASRRRRAKNETKNRYGCFSGMLDTDRIGRIKPKGWLMKVIAQLYLEKSASDSFEARQGEPGKPPELHEFVYDWHLNRYGLRTLAEANLLDLIASIRRYQADNLKARMFGQFCGLVGAERRPPEAFQFYMHCMQVMAPSGILALFPETDDGTCWLKPLKALEAVKTIFTNAAEPLQLRQFIVSRIEPLIDPKTKMYDADAVLQALLDEWQRRYERNEAHLKALFRAGDTNHDGVMTFDEWKEVIKHANDQMTEREIAQMFREALQLSGAGESIDPSTFVLIARKHRLWKWTFQPDTSGNAAAATEAKSPAENLFCMLDEALSGADNPTDQLTRLKLKTADRGDKARATVEGLEAKHASFKKLYQERKDAEAAWSAYRQLVGDLQHAIRRFNQPFKHAVRAILNIQEFLKSASPSPSSSPVGDGPRSPFNRVPRPGPSRLQGQILSQFKESEASPRRNSAVRSSWRESPAVKKTVNAIGGAQPGAQDGRAKAGSGRDVTGQSAWRPGGSTSKPGPKPFSSLAPDRPKSRKEDRPGTPERPKSPPQEPRVSNFVAKLAPEESQPPVGRPGSPIRILASPESIVGIVGARVSSSEGPVGGLGRPVLRQARPGSPERAPGQGSPGASRAPSWEGVREAPFDGSLRKEVSESAVYSARRSSNESMGVGNRNEPSQRRTPPEKSGRPQSGLLGKSKSQAQIWKSSNPIERKAPLERRGSGTQGSPPKESPGGSRRSSERERPKDALPAVAETDDVKSRSMEEKASRLESIHASLCDQLSVLQGSDTCRETEDSELKSAPSFEEALKSLERKLSSNRSGGRRSSSSKGSVPSTGRST